MKFIRPIRHSDYSALYQIAEESGVGFTSLPVHEALLKAKIERSTASFNKTVDQPGDESYLFVMEDSETGQVVGTAGIEASVGVNDAFYHYHVGKVVHASRELNVHKTVEVLTFCNDYTGTSEICTLFLREQARQKNVGRFLSKSRFLFMATHPQRFASTVIAEMRGVNDENGRSPFWEWLEKHFFSLDFPTADYLTGIGNKVFIAELMPKYPIYVNLLSEAAQKVIGQVHNKTKPALKLLNDEGFVCRGYVDIFDAGPTVEAELNQIKTVRDTRSASIIAGAVPNDAPYFIVANQSADNFRAVCEPAIINENNVIMSSNVLNALMLNNGDSVSITPI